MIPIATNPDLWKRISDKVHREHIQGTEAGEWSARKAQLAVKLYKEAGGGYRGPKSSNNSLVKWGRQHWRTRSGKPSSVTGERYLPAQAIKHLSRKEYSRTTAAKRRSMRQGKQYSRQPRDIARKTKRYRN
jgi:hypothetical protein